MYCTMESYNSLSTKTKRELLLSHTACSYACINDNYTHKLFCIVSGEFTSNFSQQKGSTSKPMACTYHCGIQACNK